jgi:hypothetical protein
LQIKTKNVSCHAADSKPVKQEVNSTVILPPLVFPAVAIERIASKTIIIQSKLGYHLLLHCEQKLILKIAQA